jgi:hypothetical protein
VNFNKFPPWVREWIPVILAVAVAAFAGTGFAVNLLVDEAGKVTVEVKPQPLDKDEQLLENPVEGAPPIVADTNQTVQPDEKQDQDEPVEGVGIHEDAKDETPPGITKEELEFGRERTATLAEDQLVEPRKLGGAETVSCPNRPVVNQSSLSQRRVGVALHFTVSPFGSINVIHRLFNTPSFGASSNYGFELISLECQRWVPENRKAWAQGAANSAYVSIEIISNNLTREQWLSTPAFKTGRLAALVREISLRNGTPLKLVDPVGCVWSPGITDHDRLECGNTHWDVGPGFPWDVFMKQVREGVKQFILTAKERKIVKGVRKPSGTGHSKRYWCRRLSSQTFWLNKATKVEDRTARLRILKRILKGRCY